MALNAFLSLKGQRQGDIKGSVTQKGREGKIKVTEASHGIAAPRDFATGQASGKREHGSYQIKKDVDRSTPLLYNALFHNEVITDWELQFFRSGPSGVEQNHFTVKLTNARIDGITFSLPDTQDAKLAKVAEQETVSFTYQKIELTWNEGGISSVEDLGGEGT